MKSDFEMIAGLGKLGLAHYTLRTHLVPLNSSSK